MPKSKKVVNRTSFIDGIITDLIDTSRRPTTQTICRYIQSLEIDSVSSRIGQAFVTALTVTAMLVLSAGTVYSQMRPSGGALKFPNTINRICFGWWS